MLKPTSLRSREDPADERSGALTDAERALRESEARMRSIVNTAADGIVTFDEQGTIESFNPAAEPLFGCAAEDALGRDINDFLPDFYAAANHTRAASPRMFGTGREAVGRRVDGTTFPTELSVSEMRLGGRRIFTLILRDVTARKEAEAAVHFLAAQLQRSNRELQDFASVAAHDLQEPLRKILAFGDRLDERCGAALGEEGRDYLFRMQNAAERMRQLIDDLLVFSRVTTRGQPFAPVDLSVVAHQVLSDLDVTIEKTAGRVEIGPLPTIEADATQMRQLLQNLIGNALKFRRPEEPPRVRVAAELIDGGAQCRLTVTDNGIGFDEKYLDRIFTIFQRLHSRHEYEGTGVGLAICRKIAERHGGTITASSRPGQGAVFVVTLPAKHPEGR
jgi:two-component system sensor kinase FixL